MNNIFKSNLKRSKIDLFHGFISIIGAIILGYLCMMVFSKYMPGDYAVKIIPSIILTPVTISCFGLWLLFSKSSIACFIKFFSLSALLILIIKVL